MFSKESKKEGLEKLLIDTKGYSKFHIFTVEGNSLVMKVIDGMCFRKNSNLFYWSLISFLSFYLNYSQISRLWRRFQNYRLWSICLLWMLMEGFFIKGNIEEESDSTRKRGG